MSERAPTLSLASYEKVMRYMLVSPLCKDVVPDMKETIEIYEKLIRALLIDVDPENNPFLFEYVISLAIFAEKHYLFFKKIAELSDLHLCDGSCQEQIKKEARGPQDGM